MDLSDSEILALFREKGQREKAFNHLVTKYQERIYWHIRKIVISHDDSDDILQNVFIKTWENLEGFREESGLYTWLYRLATNESLSFLRKRKKENHISWESFSNTMGKSLKDDLYFNGDEVSLKLQQAVLSLPEKQRLIFNMKYFDEMKYEDISEILGTSVGSLKASYHHAVKKIKKKFDLE